MNPREFHNGKIALHAGNCMEVLREIPANSIDAVCTDPPYHLTSIVKRFSRATADDVYRNAELRKTFNQGASPYARAARGFMGKEWDGGDIAFTSELWAEVLRVLKPGGHMVAFSGTRTYHRMACAMDDAGFEIRDQLAWTYGSGFPKSHDVSKGIDRAAGVDREIIGTADVGPDMRGGNYKRASGRMLADITTPATDAARKWQGWGTALKPAWEPICLARKPLSESTVAANVLRWGTGAINVDATRIASGDDTERPNGPIGYHAGGSGGIGGGSPLGRFPANLIHDGSPEVLAGFPETGAAKATAGRNGNDVGDVFSLRRSVDQIRGHDDNGGSAARFFYTAKADADDRLGSKHPTVKPVDLNRYLVRLICPRGGTVLDPFAGTGTTGAAAFIEGCRAVLIEREAEYLADIERRMELLLSGPDERARKLTKPDPHESLPLFA